MSQSPKKPTNTIGDSGGLLTIIGIHREPGVWVYECRCDCGSVTRVRSYNFKAGAIKSCGCLRASIDGLAAAHLPLYRKWNAMLQRCQSESAVNFHDYGGRGIKVCQRWMESFANFLADMGDPPEGKSIDRINPDGDYCPENCRWSDTQEQARNKRNSRLLTVRGEARSVAEWAELMGIPSNTIHSRLRYGWDDEMAVVTPVDSRKRSRKR